MSWQQETFGPLLERTLENAQVRHLAEQYDLSRDSRLARLIAHEVNTTLDAEERRRQVQRIRPGELLLCTSRGPLVLPLRAPEYVGRVVAGERWNRVRQAILEDCADRYRQLFPEVSTDMATRFLRAVWPGHAPPGARSSPLHGPRKERPWGSTSLEGQPLAELETARAKRWLERGAPRPAHSPDTFRKLMHFLGAQAGIPPAVQEPLLLDLMALRARFCPRITTLASGQMPLAAMHVEAGRTLWQSTRYQPIAPVLVTPLANTEANILRGNPRWDYERFLTFHGGRMARVLTEAYRQDGLLAYTELQWIFLASMATVSRALDCYQRKHQVILPSPGTVLDMGRMLTHKNLIVRLHLQGLSVLEIAHQTYHHPRSVDAYLKAFDSVLILHLYGLPPRLMATILGRGETLIHEYLELIAQHLKDTDTMREHLQQRGVKIPVFMSHGG